MYFCRSTDGWIHRAGYHTHAAWNDYRTLAEAMGPIDPQGALQVLNRYVRMGDSIHSEQLKELMSQANAELHNDELKEPTRMDNRQLRAVCGNDSGKLP